MDTNKISNRRWENIDKLRRTLWESKKELEPEHIQQLKELFISQSEDTQTLIYEVDRLNDELKDAKKAHGRGIIAIYVGMALALIFSFLKVVL